MAKNTKQYLQNPMLQQQQQGAFSGIKTKKYQLNTKTYIRLAMDNLLRTQWFWAFIPVALIILNLVLNLTGWYHNIWIYFLPPTIVLLYVLFWAIQFTGVTQLEQNKPMFKRMTYEIDSKQIILKLNAKEGMQIKWEMIKKAYKTKEHFLLVLSKAQFIHIPFTLLSSENDVRFLDSLLKRKKLLEEKQTTKALVK